jgi:hypothetical protein
MHEAAAGRIDDATLLSEAGQHGRGNGGLVVQGLKVGGMEGMWLEDPCIGHTTRHECEEEGVEVFERGSSELFAEMCVGSYEGLQKGHS